MSASPKTKADPEVEQLLASMEHPHKAEILALRRLILEAHPSVSELVKWNAPSFRTTGDFATFHLRGKGGARVILHYGAKKRAGAPGRSGIADPSSLLEWLAEDRAATFADLGEVEAKGPAFQAVIREWIRHV